MKSPTFPAPNEPKPPTLDDVARALNITKVTVSCALNGKGRVAPRTRQAVLETARRMGFEPNPHARSLAHGRCDDTVALFALELDAGVGTMKLQLLQQMLTARGYRAPIQVCGGSYGDDTVEQRALMSDLRRQRPRAIACFTSGLHARTLDQLRYYRDQGGIVICYDFPVELDCDQVLFDREDNTYTATRHLLELGHRRIAGCVGTPLPNPQRLAGYRRALREFGVAARPDRLLKIANGSARPEENGGKLLEAFLRLPERPSAICIANDFLAAAFIAAAQRHGLRVPQDVSVVGQDGLALAEHISAVPLCTVSQPVETIARDVVELLIRRLEGDSGPARRRVVRGALIARPSAAAFADA